MLGFASFSTNLHYNKNLGYANNISSQILYVIFITWQPFGDCHASLIMTVICCRVGLPTSDVY
jgi:hypothetical protein